MPLSTISSDQRSSIYLFNEVEFETAVKDLSRKNIHFTLDINIFFKYKPVVKILN